LASKNKLMDKAQKLLQKGKLKDTVHTLNQVMEVDPTDFRVLLKKGELEARIGDADAAKQSYTQVAEQYSQDGFYLKAIAIYKKILKLDGEEFHVYSKLASLYRKLGLDSEAKKHLKVVAEYYKAKGLKTNYHEIVVQLSELGESVTDSQIEYVQNIAEDGKTDQAIGQFRALSQKYLDAGNINQLDNLVKKMDEMGLQDMECYLVQAKAYVSLKEPKRGLQVIQKAYAIEPQNPLMLEVLAKCFLELKQPQKTLSVFNELLKIYDREGNMQGLSRVKNDIMKLKNPSPFDDEVEEEQQEQEEYETIQRDESEEFIIEEVQALPKASKAPAPKTEPKVQTQNMDEFDENEENPTRSSARVETSLSDLSLSQEEDEQEDEFLRDGKPEDPNDQSFMNVFVDNFEESEETVLAGSKPGKKQEVSEFSSIEDSIAFQSSSSYEDSIMKDLAEPTRIEDDMDKLSSGFVEKTMEAGSGMVDLDLGSFNEETVMDGDKSNPSLVGFDQFYSEQGKKEKSEISVLEEEFVSISQFIDEKSVAKSSAPSKPEKIEIHDKQEFSAPISISKPKVTPPPMPKIQPESLANDALSADVESTVDFSNLDLSEVSLSMPGMEEPKMEIASEMVPESVDDMLEDPQPESEKPVFFDEKTILDLKQEFKDSSKVEAASGSEDMFDLSEALKDEIEEFEKSFGNPEDSEEEEYLSPEEVILEFKKGVARTIDKNDHQTHYSLGVAYMEMGLIDEAISSFELASNNPETKIDATSMIGICLANKNDYDAAVELYQKVLPTLNYQDPKSLGLNYQLGEAYIALGRHVDAYKTFNKIRDVNSSFRDVKSRVKELGFNLGIKEEDHKQQSGKMIVDLKDRKKNKL
jgi:tetratricopeptide (TPR) repeat protein